ncbi:hypothetical protein P12x_006182 (plasmid) [Tundrisphaera lichenicola]|uniref:hypothetical protein n=1 Tax=Tundrisphaera lichenicola TaxID=2029860 RepID=UPI003EBFF33C
MKDSASPRPLATNRAGLIVFASSASVLALLLGVNHRLYGNLYVFNRQWIACGVALGVGSLLVVQAYSEGRRRRCLACGVLAVGLAVAGWWLVPNANGDSLARLHLRTLRLLSELRSLPLGETNQFRSATESRDRVVDQLPRFGRSIRAEEGRWLKESLSGAVTKTEALLPSDPSGALTVLKRALKDLPGPEKYEPEAPPDQDRFREVWRRAKRLRLKAAKAAALSKITGKDYQAAAGIAAELRTAAWNDGYREETIDAATEKFIDSVLFLNSLDELSR